MIKKSIKVRVFSDRPVDINIIWLIVVLLLVLLSVFLGYKYSQKCPDVVCPECKEKECPPCSLDCSTCPEKIVYKNITSIITKYICPNGEDVVNNLDDCVIEIKKSDIKPIKTSEEGTYIETVQVKPACVSGINGGEVYYKIGTTPDSIIFEVKEVGTDEEYKELKTFPGLITKYRYFTICSPNEVKCKAITDSYLAKHKIYLFRIKFDETSTTRKIEYSNEHIIDTTSTSDYLLKKCR